MKNILMAIGIETTLVLAAFAFLYIVILLVTCKTKRNKKKMIQALDNACINEKPNLRNKQDYAKFIEAVNKSGFSPYQKGFSTEYHKIIQKFKSFQ